MHVTQLPVGGLQWLGMQTINLEQILTSLLSHILAEKDTGMATNLLCLSSPQLCTCYCSVKSSF